MCSTHRVMKCDFTAFRKPKTTIHFLFKNLKLNEEQIIYPNFLLFLLQEADDEQRQVAIAVRTHRSIELSDDKFYLITCAQSSFYNTARKTRSRVRLSILHPEDPSKTPPTRLIMGNAYTFRAQLSEPDKEHRLFLKHCIAFSQLNATETLLIDDHGCSADSTIISPFNYSVPIGEPVDAAIRSMFKFPDVYRVHIQCDVVLCRESIAAKCARKYSCSLREPRLKGFLREEEHRTIDDGFGSEDELSTTESNQEEIHLVSATTAYVLEPDQELLEFVKRAEECNEWRFPWLIGLCAVLGALLAVMFIVNICLCTSLTCTCTKQDVLEKEDNSELADYDPYRIDWTANNSHLYNGNSLPRQYHTHYQEELDYNLGHQRPSSRYSSSAPSYNKTGYHNYGYR